MSSKLERKIVFRPAFDKRHEDPSKNYGIHGVDLTFLLGNEKGWMQFMVFTNWHMPHVVKEATNNPGSITAKEFYPFTYLMEPTPMDVGYHAAERQYPGQPDMSCNLLPCGKCYYDSSSLAAKELWDILVSEGSDGVWKHLEDRWQQRFGFRTERVEPTKSLT